jgi:hypothetical protein
MIMILSEVLLGDPQSFALYTRPDMTALSGGPPYGLPLLIPLSLL